MFREQTLTPEALLLSLAATFMSMAPLSSLLTLLR